MVSIDNGLRKGGYEWLRKKSVGAVLVFRGDRITLEGGDGDKEAIRFTLDPSQYPKAADLRMGDLTYLGIYELDGDTLRFCLGSTTARPTKFAVKPGGEWLYVVLKRKVAQP